MKKKNIPKIGASVGLFGVLMSRALSEKYGNNIRIMILGIAVLICITSILFVFCMKDYVLALLLLAMITPLIIAFIGLCLDNIYIGGVGIALIFIIMPIIIKIVPKYRK
jgi:ABC-type multidrug transport system permease subunit